MISSDFRHQQKVTVRAVKLRIRTGLGHLFYLEKSHSLKDQMHIQLHSIRQLQQMLPEIKKISDVS